MPELMNAFSVILAAAESANAKLVIDYSEISRFKKHAKSVFKVTDSLEDALIGNALAGKRCIGVGHVHAVKQLALMRIPSVIVSLNKNPVNHAINIYPENAQELYDDIICSFRLSEDKKVLLPVVVHIDDLLKDTREQLETLTQKIAENFLEGFTIDRPEKHLKYTLKDDMESKMIIQKASENAKKAMETVSEQWKKRTRRTFTMREDYMLEGSDFIFLSYGSISANVKIAVKKLRELGEKAGLIRAHALGPFPDLSEIAHARRVAVVDTKFFSGSNGMLYQQTKDLNKNMINFIADVASAEDFIKAFQHLKASEKLERIWMV